MQIAVNTEPELGIQSNNTAWRRHHVRSATIDRREAIGRGLEDTLSSASFRVRRSMLYIAACQAPLTPPPLPFRPSLRLHLFHLPRDIGTTTRMSARAPAAAPATHTRSRRRLR
jgi:hypothetical protein